MNNIVFLNGKQVNNNPKEALNKIKDAIKIVKNNYNLFTIQEKIILEDIERKVEILILFSNG